MALVKCKECGAEISSDAKACPRCGKSAPKRTSGCAMTVAAVLGIGFIASIAGQCSGSKQQPESAAPTASSKADTAESYAPPPPGTKSLIREISGTRNADGTVTISGVVLLPKGTKIWVERLSSAGKTLAQDKTVVGDRGTFTDGPFSDDGKAPRAGPQKVQVVSFFNGAWQPPDVLAAVGEDGKRLPLSALRPNDPEFPTAGGRVQDARTIQFPPMSEEAAVIARVKNAKLYVQGNGQAVDTVGFIVGEFAKAPGFTPIRWSASRSGSKWVVTLDCQDGGTRKQAQWEYNPVSQRVRYLDPTSKILSWMPAE